MAWGQFSLTAKPQRGSSLDYRAAKEAKLDRLKSRGALEELTQRKKGGEKTVVDVLERQAESDEKLLVSFPRWLHSAFQSL